MVIWMHMPARKVSVERSQYFSSRNKLTKRYCVLFPLNLFIYILPILKSPRRVRSKKEAGGVSIRKRIIEFPFPDIKAAPTIFDKLDMLLSNDEKLVLVIFGGMKEIINRDRVQATAYLLQKLYNVPISSKFDLGEPPLSEKLHFILTRMELDYYGLGFKLIKAIPLTLDYETGMAQNVLYRLTELGNKFVKHLCSVYQRFSDVKNTAALFRKKIVKNGYIEIIDRYAGWVYIKESLEKTEPKPLVEFYSKQLEYDEDKLVEFYRNLDLSR